MKNADVIIGTSCLGYGMDIDNISNIVVCGLPYSIEQLLQWAGRCRSVGRVTVVVSSNQQHQSPELYRESNIVQLYVDCIVYTECCKIGTIQSRLTDAQKYRELVSVVDGNTLGIYHVNVQLDDFALLRARLQRIQQHMLSVGRGSALACKLCSLVSKELVLHVGYGCARVFNHCFKCFGKHPSSGCSSGFFKVAGRYCWKCWMPLKELFGVSFHSRDIGQKCDSAALDLIKPMALAFFYDRSMSNMVCPETTLEAYQVWLFKESTTSGSVAGSGQVTWKYYFKKISMHR